MKSLHLVLALAVILGALALPAMADDGLAALVRQHVDGSDEARLKVINIGLPAIPALVEVMKTQEGRPVDRAERAIGWIIENAAADERERGKATWALVNLLLDKDQPEKVRRMAANLMGSVGLEGAVRTLAPLLGDAGLRDASLWSLQRIEGPAAREALVGAAQAGEPQFRATAIQALAARRDRPAHIFTKLAGDPSPVVRLAALAALRDCADPATAPFLEGRTRATSGEERRAALLAYIAATETLLARWKRDEARPMVRKALAWSKSDAVAAATVLEAVARTDLAAVEPEQIGAFLNSADLHVHTAAANVLVRMPGIGTEALEALIGALPGSTVPQAMAILSAVAERCSVEKRRVEPIGRTGLSVFPYWMTDPAELVQAIMPAAKASNPDLRIAALKAFGAIGDVSASAAVVEAMNDAGAPAEVRRSAFDAYLAIAAWQLHERRPEEARQIYEDALQAADDDAGRAAALRGLGQVGSQQSRPIIEAHLDAEGVVGQAALEAFIACAEGTGIHLGSRDGYVTHWWVIGPFPSDDAFGGYDRAFFPEEKVELMGAHEFEGKKLVWRHCHTSDRQGIADYVPLLDPHENTVCYSYAEVKVAQEMEARLHVGSDDGIVVWLNGERVHGINVPRGLKVGEDKVDVRVKSGVNTFLIKVIQGPGDWSSSVRLTDRNDRPLQFEQKTQ